MFNNNLFQVLSSCWRSFCVGSRSQLTQMGRKFFKNLSSPWLFFRTKSKYGPSINSTDEKLTTRLKEDSEKDTDVFKWLKCRPQAYHDRQAPPVEKYLLNHLLETIKVYVRIYEWLSAKSNIIIEMNNWITQVLHANCRMTRRRGKVYKNT